MGGDKALLKWRGGTFLSVLIERSRPWFNSVFILGGRRTYQITGVSCYRDQVPDAGPLGGLLTAVMHEGRQDLAILPVDMPLVGREVLARLAMEELSRGSDALLFYDRHDTHPLCGIYRTRLQKPLDQYLQAGSRSVFGFVKKLSVTYTATGGHQLCNINTPQQYRELLASGPAGNAAGTDEYTDTRACRDKYTGNS